MYTVAEVASMCNVSTVAIYKKLKKVNGIERFITKENNKTLIMEEGLELIKSNLQFNKHLETNEKEEPEENINGKEDLKELITVLKEQLKVKDEQLNVKDKQLIAMQELLKNSQILLKDKTTEEVAITVENSNKKKHWWQKKNKVR